MYKLMAAALLCGTLTGCAGMNSDFDCNKTATDQCLTTGEANKLAGQGKSLDELAAESTVKKPVGETLPALHNTAPIISPNRPVSVAATSPTSATNLAPRPLFTPPATTSSVTPSMARASQNTAYIAAPIKSVNDTGRVQAQRIPDATQRLWIAPWVDTDDNFHQPAVVEFVKNKSHWDEGFRVIAEGGE
jgi:conjugal transfer pilus assembly protein TraV